MYESASIAPLTTTVVVCDSVSRQEFSIIITNIVVVALVSSIVVSILLDLLAVVASIFSTCYKHIILPVQVDTAEYTALHNKKLLNILSSTSAPSFSRRRSRTADISCLVCLHCFTGPSRSKLSDKIRESLAVCSRAIRERSLRS